MKTRLPALLMLAGLLVLPGCMKVKMDTAIDKDGSGTMSMSFAMSESVAEAMKELEELGPMPGMDQEGPKLSDFEKDKMEKACKKHGVTLKKFDKSTENGAEKIEMELAFKNLDDLAKVMDEEESGGGGAMVIYKNADGNYVLKSAPPTDDSEEEVAEESEASEETPAEEFDPTKAAKAMEIMGKMMGAMSELDIVMRITVPGDIVSTTAPKQEGRTAIWEINGENMMSASMDNPEVVFSGKGLSIKADPLPEE